MTQMKNKKEQLIIDQLKQGDENAYKYLYMHHYELLCKFANEFLHDYFLSETVVSDTFFHIWEIREHLEISTSLRSYLLRAVRNRCLNHMNLKFNKKEICFSRLGPIDVEDTQAPLTVLLEQELESKIAHSIEQLSDECRRVFTLSRFEQKKHDEIARELNISVSTVKYHIKNALSKLRVDLGKYLICLLIYIVTSYS